MWSANIGRTAKTGEGVAEDVLLLWSPNVESRSFAAPAAMGRLSFR